MSTTLGGVTLPNPLAGEEGHREIVTDVGSEMTMADGSIRFHYFGSRRQFRLRWSGLTQAQKDALWLAYWSALSSASAYSPPENSETYTVLVVPGSWEAASWPESDGTTRYNVALALQETIPQGPSLGVRVSEAVSIAEPITMYLLSIAVAEAIGVAESVSVDLLSPAVSESIAVIESATVAVV